MIERLRGDSAEAFRTLRHADELAERSGAGPDLARAYLHVSLTQGTPEERDALAKFWKERWTTPEFVYFLRTYWQPEGPLTEAELASRVQGTSDAWARETWLSRWIELFPSSAEPFRARATWVQSGKHPDAQMQWRIAEDLKRAVELDPKDASSRALLGIYEAIRGEPAAATEHLKAARLLGVSPESVLRFSANVEKDNPKAFAVIQAALR
ncbi:hypothetical protein HY251_08510 [bacterium]|nr:hypothetical protein [bacterium]